MAFPALCLLIALQASPRGIEGKLAPSLQDVEWIQTVEGATPSIKKGEVNYVFFFQSWCPGCHSHGFPTLQKFEAKFPEVNFIAVQTVFEGFGTNTKERALADVKSFGLDIPVGHDGAPGAPSPLIRRFQGGGTPWSIIIDKKGIVRFNAFRIPYEGGVEILTTLQQEPDYELLPNERGGQELVGVTLEQPSFGEFDSPLTLYRWWTDTCTYCEASLPAIDSLHDKYADRGLKVVGVYHPKPPSKKVTEKEVLEIAAVRQFKGDVVIDSDWAQLKKWWIDTGNRQATSVSILVDSDGVVRFVHPGPVLFPSDEKRFAQENNDFNLLERAIDSLLPTKPIIVIEGTLTQ